MVLHACNPSYSKAEAGGSRVQGQPAWAKLAVDPPHPHHIHTSKIKCKKRTGYVAQVVECLPSKLSSNPIPLHDFCHT
jgi:hypothetical protein